MSQQIDPAIKVWPLPLPANFLRKLGYDRIADTPQRYVGLFWQSAGDEAAHDDGRTSSAGRLHNYEFLGYFWRPTVDGFRAANQLDFGGSQGPEKHWLIVDGETNEAFFAPVEIARRAVRLQRLHDLAGQPTEVRT